ncbi:MAG TPA: FecR domain-containing protein, partial [Reyranella sp.]
MGNAAIGGGRLLAATLLGVAALATISTNVVARVGVTSGADGDPLGKPPNENERILRIGIDVQANELITTNANDRAHLVFLDGSSLTVGPNARLTIDKFVYDPNTQRGELAINASKGVLRLVGGKISKNTPITITTPATTIGIRGGITIVSVTQVQTIANFVFGTSMTVTAGGQTQTATRAGSAIVTNVGAIPGVPTLVKPGSLTAALSQLEGASSNSNSGADQSAQNSGFSGKNSGQPLKTPDVNQPGPPNPTNNTLTNAVSNTNPAGQPLGNSTPQNNQTVIIVTSPNPNP